MRKGKVIVIPPLPKRLNPTITVQVTSAELAMLVEIERIMRDDFGKRRYKRSRIVREAIACLFDRVKIAQKKGRFD